MKQQNRGPGQGIMSNYNFYKEHFCTNKQNFSTDTRKTAQVYAHSKANKICSLCAKLQRPTMQLHEDTKIGRNYI